MTIHFFPPTMHDGNHFFFVNFYGMAIFFQKMEKKICDFLANF